MTFHVQRAALFDDRRAEFRPRPRNEVTSDDGSRKTGAPKVFGSRSSRAPLHSAHSAGSLARTPLVLVPIVSYAPDARRPGMHACISQILIFSLLSRRQISNADTWRDIGQKR